MNGWTIVYTSTLPQQIYLPQSLLESEGIETLLKDELTAQVTYSNAVGGAKLMVRENDAARAVELLKAGGYIAS